jgi:hypothetical protein
MPQGLSDCHDTRHTSTSILKIGVHFQLRLADSESDGVRVGPSGSEQRKAGLAGTPAFQVCRASHSGCDGHRHRRPAGGWSRLLVELDSESAGPSRLSESASVRVCQFRMGLACAVVGASETVGPGATETETCASESSGNRQPEPPTRSHFLRTVTRTSTVTATFSGQCLQQFGDGPPPWMHTAAQSTAQARRSLSLLRRPGAC